MKMSKPKVDKHTDSLIEKTKDAIGQIGLEV